MMDLISRALLVSFCLTTGCISSWFGGQEGEEFEPPPEFDSAETLDTDVGDDTDDTDGIDTGCIDPDTSDTADPCADDKGEPE